MKYKKMEPLKSEHFEHMREIDPSAVIHQIGAQTFFAISGGRMQVSPAAVILPVSNGYSVMIQLAWDDTYTVRRLFKRNGQQFIKASVEGVYCDVISQAAYQASCFRSNEEFGEKVLA